MKFNYKYAPNDVVKVKGYERDCLIERRYGSFNVPAYVIREETTIHSCVVKEEDILSYATSTIVEEPPLSKVPDVSTYENTARLKNYLRSVQSHCPTLDRYSNNFSAKALKGDFSVCLGRDEEMQTIEHLMYRRTKPNIMLLGKAGTGKTAIVEGLAYIFNQRFINGEDETPTVIMEVCTNSLVGGSKYRGEFEERVGNILKEISQVSFVNIVLFIDEVHCINVLGASEGATSLGQVLKPALARGQIKLIGATTTDEYKQYLENDTAFCRRFNIIEVNEIKGNKAKTISQGILEDYGKFFNIDISQVNIGSIYEENIEKLTGTFPDNLINVIDETLAYLKCNNVKTATMTDFANTLKRYVKTATKKLGFG